VADEGVRPCIQEQCPRATDRTCGGSSRTATPVQVVSDVQISCTDDGPTFVVQG
jgi:hypothetical protein